MENIVLNVELLLKNLVGPYVENLTKFLEDLILTLSKSGSCNIHIGANGKPLKVTTTIEAAKAIIQSFLLLQDATASELSKEKDPDKQSEMQEILNFLGNSLDNTVNIIEERCKVKIPLNDPNKTIDNDLGSFISNKAKIPREEALQLLDQYDSGEEDDSEEDEEDDEYEDDSEEDEEDDEYEDEN